MLIAHRGIHNNIDIPENSLLAFKKALENNLSIELDIHITKDLKLVVFHDDNLNRMVGKNIFIENLTLNEIKKLRLINTNEVIPTLKEVLNLVNGKVLIDIEVKSTKKIKEISKKLIKELNDYDGDIIIKSFEPKIIKYLKNYNCKYKYGLLLRKNYNSKLKNIIMNSNIVLYYCNPDFLAISKSMAKNIRFKKLRKKYPIYIWTINNKEELNKYKDYCDHYICNNIPY